MLEGMKKKARRASVTKFAAASGLHLLPEPEPGVMVSEAHAATFRKIADKVSATDVPFSYGPLGPTEHQHVFKDNVLSGQWQGLPVTEADCSIIATRLVEVDRSPAPPVKYMDFGYKRFSAVVADLPAALPDLMIQRKTPGLDARPTLPYHIESGSLEFNRQFQVTTADTTFAAKLIDASMITWLLSAHLVSAFMFKLYGHNLLLVWTGLLPRSRLGAIFDTAKGFTDHIPRQIWAEYGTRGPTLLG